MTRTLTYSRKAQADLDEIFDFIAADNPRRAATYFQEIRQSCPGLTPLAAAVHAGDAEGMIGSEGWSQRTGKEIVRLTVRTFVCTMNHVRVG